MSNLDMSLDDMIKMNKKSNPKPSRSRNPSSAAASLGLGPNHRGFKRSTTNRTTPYSSKPVQAPNSTWDHNMFAEKAVAYPAQGSRVSAIETGTKLLITNLDYGVSNEDIKELFSEVGDIKRSSVHYDRSGRSEGTAEVVFSRRKDAEAAVTKYNNVQLDGKLMIVEIVGTNIATAAAAVADPPPSSNSMSADHSGAPRSRRGGFMGRTRGGSRGMRRTVRGRGRGRGEKLSVEDLDADLDKYHAGVMETN